MARDGGRFTFAGELQLGARIGQGGMGEVFEARYTAAGDVVRRVVVKRLLPRLHDEAQLRELFFHEARLTAQLTHPNIVHILGIGALDGEPVLVMEHIAGRPLSALVVALAADEGHLAVGVAASVLRDVGRALAYAHELSDADGRPLRLVHRDVSPSNIMVGYHGAVKLLDFGIAKALASLQDQTEAGVLKGKLGYMAPERLRGQPFDHRSDLFAAGVVLYETLTRRRLYDAQTAESLRALLARPLPPPSQLNPAVPPALDALCARALEHDPERRLQTGTQLADALDDVLWELRWGSGRLAEIVRRQEPARPLPTDVTPTPSAQQPPSAQRPSERAGPHEPTRSPRARRWPRGLAAAVTLVAILTLVAWRMQRQAPSLTTTGPTVSVRIDSEPPNAELTLAGDPPLHAQTPFAGRVPLTSRTRHLQLRLAGYAPVDLVLRPRSDVTLDVPLQPLAAPN